MEFELIMPVAASDVETAKQNITYIRKWLCPGKIVIITSGEIRRNLENELYRWDDIRLLDEDEIQEGLSFETIRNYLKLRGAEKRTGWYLQQFIKMAYAFKCETEFYLTWDADTIPIRYIPLQEKDGRPILAVKQEFHPAYFDTIKSLLNLDKTINESFIAEYMIIKKEIMIQLINMIDRKSFSAWFINILENIAQEHLGASGFSEFETYGTYVMSEWPDVYEMRKAKALRRGKQIFGSCPSEEIMEWLSKSYTTISFEKWDRQYIFRHPCGKKLFRKIVPANIFVKSCFGVIKLKKYLTRYVKIGRIM